MYINHHVHGKCFVVMNLYVLVARETKILLFRTHALRIRTEMTQQCDPTFENIFTLSLTQCVIKKMAELLMRKVKILVCVQFKLIFIHLSRRDQAIVVYQLRICY